MLYPNFHELVALKDRKMDLTHPSSRSVKSTVPGNHRSPFRGQGLEFDAVREYVPGDDIRNIDWRVTARTGSPHLKLFKEERERQVVICLDMNKAMRFGTRNTFKSVQAARTAALLGWQAIAHQDRVSACLFGDIPNGIQFFPPQKTRKSLSAFLKIVAAPPTEQHQISFDDVLPQIRQLVPAGSLVYLISDFMEIGFQQERGIKRLKKHCNLILIAINDQADKKIVPVGMVDFYGSGKEKLFVNTDNISGRKAYAAQWDENRQRLSEIVFRLKTPLIELTTESDIQRDLAVGLKKIARRKRG